MRYRYARATPGEFAMALCRLLLLCWMAFASVSASAQATLDDVLAAGRIRVGSTGDYKPFSYRPEGGEFVGLDVELAEDLAKALGVRLELVATGWPTLMSDLSAHRFDLALSGISVNLERQRLALFSLPYLSDGKTPIARCEDKERFQTLEQIDQAGVRLLVNPGGTNERFIRAHVRRASVAVYPDNVTIFDRLAAGDADVMITDAIEARLQQRLQPALCAIHPDAPFDYSEKAALLSRDLLFKAYVDQWLHQLAASGMLDRKREFWLAYPWQFEPLRQLIDQRLALMVDVARYKWNAKAQIEDLPREAQIIAQLTQRAAESAIPAELAESFFRAQIEAAKTLQREHFARWEKAGAGRFEQVPDLATQLRPKIDTLSARMLSALAENVSALRDPVQRQAASRLLPLRSASLSPAAARHALQPLEAH